MAVLKYRDPVTHAWVPFPLGAQGDPGPVGPAGPSGPLGPAGPPGMDSGWHYLGYAGEPKLRSGITPYDLVDLLWAQPRYRRDGAGCTFLEGLLSPVAASATPLFTLPVGFRPAYRQVFSTDIGTSGIAQVVVFPNGDVVFSGATGNYFSLNGITFMADDAQTITWTDFTLVNGWTNFDVNDTGPVSYFIDSAGDVHLRGVVKGGALGAIAVLPTGAHQSDFYQMYQAAAGGNSSGLARVEVSTDGTLTLVGYTGGGTNAWVSLNGIVVTNPTGTWPITLRLTNGWSQFGGAWPNASMRVNRYGVASLRGLITGGATGNIVSPGAIPPAMSPTLSCVYLTSANPSGAGARVDVTKEGALALSGYQNGGTNGYVALNQRWFVRAEGLGGGGGSTAGPQGPAGPAGQDEVTIAHQPAPSTSGLELWVDLDTDIPAAGTGIPPGGSAGQVLSKDSGADYAATWQNSAMVWDTTYGLIPRMRAGLAVVTLSANGIGSFLLPFSPPIVGIERYAFTMFNANFNANSALISGYNPPTPGTGVNMQVRYENGQVGGCGVDWVAVYKG